MLSSLLAVILCSFGLAGGFETASHIAGGFAPQHEVFSRLGMVRGWPQLLRRLPKRLEHEVEPEKRRKTRVLPLPLFDEPREINEHLKYLKEKIQLIGQKLFMDRVYSPDGIEEPVTIIKIYPQQIIRFRQFGGAVICFGKELGARRFSKKTYLGIIGINFGNYAHTREVKLTPPNNFCVGQILDATILQQHNVTSIMVTGVSAGKGFQGVMAKYGFGGGPASHGTTKFHRRRGSSGAGTHISRVLPGTRMAGRGGSKTTSIRGLRILAINPSKNLVMLRGCVPGKRSGTLLLTVDKESQRVLYRERD